MHLDYGRPLLPSSLWANSLGTSVSPYVKCGPPEQQGQESLAGEELLHSAHNAYE